MNCLLSFRAGLGLMLLVGSLAAAEPSASQQTLEQSFQEPPASAKPWAYWWWLDGAASKEGITADFEAMKAKGIAGALLFDAGEGGPDAPKGPVFMSEAWRELFRHAAREADRLGIELSVNLCSGWDAGGTWVTPENAAKELAWTETLVEGPGEKILALAQPAVTDGFYRDIAVLAMPAANTGTNPAISKLELKAGRAYAEGPSCNALADTLASNAIVAAECRLDQVEVLTTRPVAENRVKWRVPAGKWRILRFGYTLLGSRTKCTSPGAIGYEIDFFSRAAFDDHFAHTAKVLIGDARKAGAKSLKYLHVDSYEAGNPSWTAKFREEFRARRGYDLLPWMPVLAGRVVESVEATHRLLWDIRRTIADLYADNYYGELKKLAHRAGLGIHPESSGPFWHQIDALQCAGLNDVPMTEFWKRKDEDKEWVWWLTGQEGFCDLVKQAASAAHVYGRPICQAEAFTTMGPNWEEDPFAMKDVGDRAFCAGLTRNVLCFYVHQPQLGAFPGYQWEAAGTHFDSHVTWWDMSGAWLKYLARCQLLLRQGLFVADFCYFYGEDVPNYVPARSRMDPALPPGFDCDSINAEALLERIEVRHGRLTLPDGMSYRYLVLPHRKAPAMSPTVLRKIKELVKDGATLIGPPPQRAPGLTDWPRCDQQAQKLAQEMWGTSPGVAGERKVGQGRVIWGRELRQILAADQVAPDVEFRDLIPSSLSPRFDGVTVPLDWIHRRNGDAEIYFLANISVSNVSVSAAFRASGRQPELWDAVTGQIRPLPQLTSEDGRTIVPLKFEPKQSFFVLFRKPLVKVASQTENFPAREKLLELTGPWEAAFDPNWGGPPKSTFEQLADWTKHPEPGIRYYSGAAKYRKSFVMPELAAWRTDGAKMYLELGVVKNLAQVRLNGRELGTLWTAPWSLDISSAIKPGGTNELEIAVVNLWPNRLIGDAPLPKDQRRTRTNVRKFDKPGQRLLPSGLLGPVTIQGAR